VKLEHSINSGLVAVVGGLIVLVALSFACEAQSPETDTTVAVASPQPATGSAADSWLPGVVEATAPSIVRVSVQRADGAGVGTGIVFDSDGSIVTNWHVVEDARDIRVILHTGEELEATLLREDLTLDLAILTVDAYGLTPATLGNSDTLRVGEDVVSIGHAFGLTGGPSVSRGVVSALQRTVADRNGNVFHGLIQTDAAINIGSSGGALANASGEVIGINVGTIDIGQGANFALDINRVVDGATRLVSLGERARPGYLGVGGVDVTPYLAFQRALPVSEGFGIRYVDPESPAADGFMVDDIIVSIDNTPIRGKTDFTEFLRTHPTGTEVVVTTIRGTVIIEIPVTLGMPGA
jgi:S1-C subfamily serine protease